MGIITCGWPSSFRDNAHGIVFLLISFSLAGKSFLQYSESKSDCPDKPVPEKYLTLNSSWHFNVIFLYRYTQFITLSARVIINGIKIMWIWIILTVTVRLLFL